MICKWHIFLWCWASVKEKKHVIGWMSEKNDTIYNTAFTYFYYMLYLCYNTMFSSKNMLIWRNFHKYCKSAYLLLLSLPFLVSSETITNISKYSFSLSSIFPSCHPKTSADPPLLERNGALKLSAVGQPLLKGLDLAVKALVSNCCKELRLQWRPHLSGPAPCGSIRELWV